MKNLPKLTFETDNRVKYAQKN